MKTLVDLVGQELDSQDFCRQLYFILDGYHAPAVGALHVTCSDESERECNEAFQRQFSDQLLPSLKFGEKSHFRLANLGARYEWGAVRIAEEHFATPAAEEGYKLMVVKLNAHICIDTHDSELIFGRMDRYATSSVYCGAIHSLLDGGALPFHIELQETFLSEGYDRLAVLRDETQVEREKRGFFAAAVNARLQARRVAIDIQDASLHSPTLFFVLPCVTLNRKGRDTEILCGIYEADYRTDEGSVCYRGIGDDPAKLTLEQEMGQLVLRDDQSGETRGARDHRQLARERWRQSQSGRRERSAEGDPASEVDLPPPVVHPEVKKVLAAVDPQAFHDTGSSQAILKTLLRTLSHVDPAPSALLCFAEGVAAIHHLHRIERIAHDVSAEEEARKVLEDVCNRVDFLSPGRTREVIDLLSRRDQG